MLNLDFSSVPSREPLEEGIYNLTIAKVEEANSSTGNPMLKVEYDVNGVEGNRKLWDNYVLIDKCMWKLKELLLDKLFYLLEYLENTPNLDIKEGMVEDLIIENNNIKGVILENKEEI